MTTLKAHDPQTFEFTPYQSYFVKVKQPTNNPALLGLYRQQTVVMDDKGILYFPMKTAGLLRSDLETVYAEVQEEEEVLQVPAGYTRVRWKLAREKMECYRNHFAILKDKTTGVHGHHAVVFMNCHHNLYHPARAGVLMDSSKVIDDPENYIEYILLPDDPRKALEFNHVIEKEGHV